MMTWLEKDARYIWHPYTQMKTAAPSLPIVRGEGALLMAEDGKNLYRRGILLVGEFARAWASLYR